MSVDAQFDQSADCQQGSIATTYGAMIDQNASSSDFSRELLSKPQSVSMGTVGATLVANSLAWHGFQPIRD